MTSKRAADLVSGDLVVIHNPAGEARVTNILPSKTEVKSKQGRYGDALIVCFEVINGAARGVKQHDFVHEEDRIRLV